MYNILYLLIHVHIVRSTRIYMYMQIDLDLLPVIYSVKKQGSMQNETCSIQKQLVSLVLRTIHTSSSIHVCIYIVHVHCVY